MKLDMQLLIMLLNSSFEKLTIDSLNISSNLVKSLFSSDFLSIFLNPKFNSSYNKSKKLVLNFLKLLLNITFTS